MKRLLMLFCLLSFSQLIFAADDLDNLINKARDLRKAGKVQEAKATAEQAVALARRARTGNVYGMRGRNCPSNIVLPATMTGSCNCGGRTWTWSAEPERVSELCYLGA